MLQLFITGNPCFECEHVEDLEVVSVSSIDVPLALIQGAGGVVVSSLVLGMVDTCPNG